MSTVEKEKNEITLIKPVTCCQFLYQIKILDANHFDALPSEVSLDEMRRYFMHHAILSHEEWQSWIDLYDQLPQVDLTQVNILSDVFNKEFCRQHFVLPFIFVDSLPLEKTEDLPLLVAMKNPLDYPLIDKMAVQLNRHIEVYLADENALNTQIMQQLFGLDDILEKASQFTDRFANLDFSLSLESFLSVNAADMGSVLIAIVQKAYYHNVSDIHIEANVKKINIIFRMNNILTKQLELPVKMSSFLLRHIILKGNGDVDQNIKPQDLSFSVFVGDKKSVQIRASVIHVLGGYSIVLRLLFSKKIQSIENFITHEELVYHLKNNYLKAGGLLLIAGPPSQGKTTMLYHILQSYIQSWPIKKIITVEDPVEILLDGVNQVNVMPEQGLDFHDMIRASLRQNPDILMIGELRDPLSAAMAVRAGLTGLPILTTIHARNTPDIIARLQNLDLALPVLSKCIEVLVSARLVNTLCLHCRIQEHPSLLDQKKVHHLLPDVDLPKDAWIYYPFQKGCEHCFYTGYSGRKFMIECLIMNEPLREALLKNDLLRFQTLAYENMRGLSLKHQLMELFLQGSIAITDLHDA